MTHRQAFALFQNWEVITPRKSSSRLLRSDRYQYETHHDFKNDSLFEFNFTVSKYYMRARYWVIIKTLYKKKTVPIQNKSIVSIQLGFLRNSTIRVLMNNLYNVSLNEWLQSFIENNFNPSAHSTGVNSSFTK